MAAPPPAKRRRAWLRILMGLAAVLLVLVVSTYLIVTSSAFLKSAVLPRVSQAIGAEVTVSRASIHPFSAIALWNFKAQPKGQAPIVTAPEVRVRYHLWDILRGHLRVDDITLVSPTLELVENPDGSSNLDPLLKALKGKPAPPRPAPPARPSKPPQIDLRQFTLSDATVVKIKNYPDGRRDVLELTNVNVTLTNLKNGQTARLQLDAALGVVKNPPAGAGGSLRAGIKGDWQLALTPDLKPAAANGQTHLNVSSADGVFADFSAFSAALECDATPTEIKQLELHFQRQGAPLGQLAVSGPLNLEKMEGRLQVTLQGVDRRLLNLAGATRGLDFGATTVRSTNEIVLAKSGADIAASGRFVADHFQVTRAGQTTPTLDFSAEYAVTVDTAAQTAQLHALTLTGIQNERPLLAARLSQPMSLAWGNGVGGVGNSALDLKVTNLNLADWRPFLGNTVSAGQANVTMKLTSQQAGKRLGFDLNSQINGLVARIGSDRTFHGTLALDTQGRAENFKQFDLRQYRVRILRQDQPLLTLSGSGTYDLAGASADMQVALQASLAGLCEAFPQAGASVSSGTLELKGRVTQKQNTQTVAGHLVLADFTGQIGNNSFRDLGSAVDVDASRTPDQIQIKKLNGTLNCGGKAAGNFDVTGTYDPADEAADAQVALRVSLPGVCEVFPQPGILVSAGTLELKCHVAQKQKTQTVAGHLALADFTGQVSKNSFRDCGSAMDVDASRTPDQIQIKKLNGTLTQGGNAGGNFNLTGSYDSAHAAAQWTAVLSGFNQDGLRPFLEPLLAGKKLVSVAVNGDASVQYDPARVSAIKADLQVTNLVVNDPTGQIPATPLAVRLQMDTALQKRSADIQRFQIGLTPTARGQNQIQLQGRIDFSRPKAVEGDLKLSADSLDLTPYYDLFAGGAKTGKPAPPSAAPPPGPAAASEEPPARTLPLHNFTVAANIGQLYLREVAITNLQTTVKLDTNRVIIKPFQLALNGAPVNANADLDLSVPGYKYEFAADADRIPFAPLVDAFAPDRQGQLGGTLTAHAKINGAGCTGADLQKNLAGQFSVGATNLNLAVVNVRSSILKTLINVVATIPQLVSSPESGLTSLIGRVMGQKGGLMDQLQQSPIQAISAGGQAGGGRINVQHATVQSAAFEADAPGDIGLAPVLTNSVINFPVTISLSQPIAQQLNLAAANTAGAGGYVSLPQFLTLTGTLGEPKTQIKKSALAGLVVTSIGSGLLNQATNPASPVGNLLDQLLRRAH
ncbi:MAG: AsmA family protein [Verrucomicrobiota bacterium]|nr:AsmA family protein [Verrucomicrobiota bacterium]